MPSELDVVNQALNLIGRLPVTNVNDDDSAFLMSNRLAVLYPELLKSASWNFAIAYRFDNTPLTQNISPDFQYNYQLPANYGRFDRFSWSLTTQFGFYYRIIDNVIMTNARPISYYYVVSDASYSVITSTFQQALVFYVASQTCLALTNDKSLTAYLNEQYYEWLARAVLQNDQEREIESTPFNDFNRQAYI